MKRLEVAVLWTYVVLTASDWVLQTASPSTLPAEQAEILVYGLVCMGAGTSRPRLKGIGRPHFWGVIGSGLLLFGLPSLLMQMSVSTFPRFTRVALLALIPTFVGLISAARESSGANFLGLLGASLAGVAGAFLLLPADPALLLQQPAPGALLVVLILSVALGSYLGYGAARGVPFNSLLVLMLGPSLVLAGVRAMVMQQHLYAPTGTDVVSLLWNAAEIVLLIYVIRVVAPVVLSARYLLVPLITAAEGYAYLRPALTWRMVLGAALLIFGSVRLMARGSLEEDSGMSLL